MRRSLLIILVITGIISTNTLESKTINNQQMETKLSTLRLIYPQWQGGIVAHWMPDIPGDDASRGYYLGAQLLHFLAPESNQNTQTVPVSLDINDRQTENGIHSYKVILEQTKAALEIIQQHNPERIVTLGGDCAVSIVPFTYLANKYPDDVAIVWIDAHPDVTLPYDDYKGYHAMALTACMGMGDQTIMDVLPGKVGASNAIIVGLRSWDEGMKERQGKLGIKGLSPSEVSENSSAVLDWLKNTGASKVVIHFDMDALDPTEIIAAVGTDPDGMKIDEAVRVINDIASEFDVVGLTVAEPMPRVAIRIRNMLNQMPLLKD